MRLQKLPVVIFVGPAAEDPSVPWAFSLSAALAFDFVAVAAKLFAGVNLAEFANFYGTFDVFGSIEIVKGVCWF